MLMVYIGFRFSIVIPENLVCLLHVFLRVCWSSSHSVSQTQNGWRITLAVPIQCVLRGSRAMIQVARKYQNSLYHFYDVPEWTINLYHRASLRYWSNFGITSWFQILQSSLYYLIDVNSSCKRYLTSMTMQYFCLAKSSYVRAYWLLLRGLSYSTISGSANRSDFFNFVIGFSSSHNMSFSTVSRSSENSSILSKSLTTIVDFFSCRALNTSR